MEHSPQASAKKLIPTKQCTASLINHSSVRETGNYALRINKHSLWD